MHIRNLCPVVTILLILANIVVADNGKPTVEPDGLPVTWKGDFGSNSKRLEISGLALTPSNDKLYAVSERGGKTKKEASEPVILEFTLNNNEVHKSPPRVLKLDGLNASPVGGKCNAELEAICVYNDVMYVCDEVNLVIYGFAVPQPNQKDTLSPKITITLKEVDKNIATAIRHNDSDKSIEGLVVVGSKLEGIKGGTASTDGTGPWFYLLDERANHNEDQFASVLYELVAVENEASPKRALTEVARYVHDDCYRMSDLSITPEGNGITDLRAILCQDGDQKEDFQECSIVQLHEPANNGIGEYSALGELGKCGDSVFYLSDAKKFPKVEGLAFVDDQHFFLATDNDAQSIGKSNRTGTVLAKMALPPNSSNPGEPSEPLEEGSNVVNSGVIAQQPAKEREKDGKDCLQKSKNRISKSQDNAIDLSPSLWVSRGVPHGFHPPHPMTSGPVLTGSPSSIAFGNCFSPAPKLPPVFVHQPRTVPRSDRMAELWMRFPEGVNPWVSVNFVDYPPEGNIRVFQSSLVRPEPRRYYISARYRQNGRWVRLFARPAQEVGFDEVSNSSYVDLIPGSRVSVTFGRFAAKTTATTAEVHYENQNSEQAYNQSQTFAGESTMSSSETLNVDTQSPDSGLSFSPPVESLPAIPARPSLGPNPIQPAVPADDLP